jgi:pseudouridine-5'-phosphate glycosidase
MNKEYFSISKEINDALQNHIPIIALESAVITHGLPRPVNLKLAKEMEIIIRSQGGIPSTIAVMNGIIKIGLTSHELEILAFTENARKISPRDFGIALSKKMNGGTTVAGTIFAASQVGIQVFATGGIGGVHRNSNFDISADLSTMGHRKMVVVCAGAKAILDLPATLEVLETYGIPVIGFQTDEFPAFYSSHSGLGVDSRAESIEDISALVKAHWVCGNSSSVLIAVPPPKEFEMNHLQIESALQNALEEANRNHIHGAATTPFLLQKMNELTGGLSLKTNLMLLRKNAEVATKIAVALSVNGGLG